MALSEKLGSGTPNLANPIITRVTGFLHLNISGYMEKLSTTIK